MDEDMSRLSGDDSRLSDTNSLMVNILTTYEYYSNKLMLNHIIIGRKTFNFWIPKTCYRIY